MIGFRKMSSKGPAMDTRKPTPLINFSPICDPQDACGYRDCAECQRLRCDLNAVRELWVSRIDEPGPLFPAPGLLVDTVHADSDEVMSVFLQDWAMRVLDAQQIQGSPQACLTTT
jgi:hypothetical protein